VVGNRADVEDYVELVLSAVEQIPPGQVATYGDLAELVGTGGPRQVGSVMSRHGAGVPWWRVVRADGRPAKGLEAAALVRLRAEDCPLRGDGCDRVDLPRARFAPAPTSTDANG
jgi:alkylated DNA nucleotide flippase Atl1